MKRISLNGTWDLRWDEGERGDRLSRLVKPGADLSRALPAQVPGDVHDDLVRAGWIGEPTVELNTLSARWVEEMFWQYRRTFRSPRRKPGERVWLVLENVASAATVHLNGKEIGKHANYFHPFRADVTDHLTRDENVLVVRVESGLFQASDRPGEGYGVRPSHQLSKRIWIRAPQCAHGWDWAPRLLNVGLHGNARLEIASAVRPDQLAVTATVSDDLSTGTVRARWHVEGLGKRTCPAALRLEVPETRQTVSVPARVKPGANRLEAALTVANPDLWWPVNHGAQTRYTVRVTLSVKGRAVETAVRRVGFRHLRVNQDPHPQKGRWFVVEVNRKPIFCKGGNFVPADIVFSRIGRRQYETLVSRALESNFNFLRVWGGGLYENDAFYDVCDERGILVWQEFIFACAKYPVTDEALLADIRREARYQVRRLAHHPSLVVWCGNNEMEWGAWHWGYEKGVALPDYALYHSVLPRILQEEDGTRYYQASSPISPDGAEPNDPFEGDQHPWSIGFGDTDFRKYRDMVCRFPNEGGILGPNALPTVRACLPPGMRKPGSFAWEIHDNAVSYWGDHSWPDLMLEQWVGRKLSAMTIEDYVYWAGVVQGEGLSEYVSNFRRRMFDCASAIFWMYNDCWPATRSWTTVDYFLRRTPAFHPVRRAMAPLTVVVVREKNGVQVFGVNEGDAREVRVRYGLFSLAGAYVLDERRDARLTANAGTLLGQFDAKIWDRAGVKTHAAFAILEDANGRELVRHRLLLPYFKEMKWPKAAVRVNVRNGQAVFSCPVFAWRVCLDLDGEKVLPDNFFDIYPGIPTVLPWPRRLGPPRILRVGNGATVV